MLPASITTYMHEQKNARSIEAWYADDTYETSGMVWYGMAVTIG